MVTEKNKQKLVTFLFGLTIFLSAFLLFQIQPMISKIIQPWFGGGSAVWTAAMLFFQALLLGGYAYAHIINRLNFRIQAIVHFMTLAATSTWVMFFLLKQSTPVIPGSDLKPEQGAFPVWQVLHLLLNTIGIPYLLLATTSSLSQAWYARLLFSKSPYSFYALSNTASFLALISYPVFIEPNWSVKEQASGWTIAFLVFIFLFGFCTIILYRSTEESDTRMIEPARSTSTGKPSRKKDPARTSGMIKDSEIPTPKIFLIWIGLAACPSVLLLAMTNQITQDIASVPFLWVLPLSLYLISFVISFTDSLTRSPVWLSILAFLSLFLGYVIFKFPNQFSMIQMILANSFLLLVVCVFFHSLLYKIRPHPANLTYFYLAMSVGGVLGGVLVNLVATILFPDYWEYPLTLIVCAVAITVLAFKQRSTWLFRLRIPILILSIVFTILLGQTTFEWVDGSVETYRNFYGVLRIREMEYDNRLVYNLVHGRIIHGSQAIGEKERGVPTRYYSPSTGIAVAITNHPRRLNGQSIRLGMVGLGIGTIATYGKPEDTFRFYEINPTVIEIAQNPRFFSYITDSQANIEIIPGDARLSMENEILEAKLLSYDILAIDAFSGDSIPIHLIDYEAVSLYLSLLKQDGMLAFHISNRYLDLEPVLGRLVEEFHLYEARITGGDNDWLGTNATWILLSRDPVTLGTPGISAVKQSVKHIPGMRIWTDDYSNIFQALK